MAIYDNGQFQGIQPQASSGSGSLYDASGRFNSAPAPTPAKTGQSFARSLLPNLNQGPAIANDLRSVATDAIQGGRDIGERALGSTQQHPVSTALQALGLGAKTAGDLVFGVPARAVERVLPDAVRKPAESLFSKGVSAVVNSAPVQAFMKKAGGFATAHPEAAANVGAAGNIAGTFLGAGAAHEAAPVIEDGIKAGAEGAAGVAEKALGPVSEHFAQQAAAKEAERTLALTSPVLSKAEKETALAAGRGTSGGMFTPDSIAPTARDIERADVAHPFIAGTQDPNQAITKINDAIAAKSDVIKTGLQQSGDPTVNRAQLRTYLSKFQDSPERQIILAGDPAAKKAYNGVLDTFMSVVNKQPKTVSGLLEARKQFDQIAKDGMKGVFDGGTVSARKQAILDIRRQANQYIEDQIPTGSAMKEVLHQQNLLYEAADNIAAKNAQNVGKTGVTQFLQAHPTATKVGASVMGGAGLGAAGVAVKDHLGL